VSRPSLDNYRSSYRTLIDTSIDDFLIHLSDKRAISNREARRKQERTCALVDIGAGCPIAGVARIARACEGASGVVAHRVGVAVVGPICARGVRPVTSSIAPKRVRAIQHTVSTTLGLGGHRSGSIDYDRT
jgi:hypothetical protein